MNSKLLTEYTALAGTYDQRWARYLDASLAMTLEFIPEPAATQILDVACGTGLLLQALSDRFDDPQLTGIDRVPRMLCEARRRLGSRATLVEGDAENLPFKDAEFDLIVCTSALHYFTNPENMFREIRRVLSPSGSVVITDWSRDYLSMKLLNRILPMTRHAHAHTFTTRELELGLSHAGFRVEKTVKKKIDWFWGLMTVRAGGNNAV